jgi:CelD/BcsL family acetyltransferase involved in cellulose biosynthesis
MRSDIRKKTRKLESHKDLSFAIHGEEEDLERKFDELFVLHNKGFRVRSKDKDEKSTFNGEDIKRFHYDIIASFRPRHWIKLFSMYHKQRLIGCMYAFQFKNNIYGYQSGFDRQWDRYSPGTVTAGYCIRESIDAGLSEFHYLRGCEDYKSRWTSEARKTIALTVINRTMRGAWYGLSVCRVMQLKRWVKHYVLRGKS